MSPDTVAPFLVSDARSVSDAWLDRMELVALTGQSLGPSGDPERTFDVVAVGKASREMIGAVATICGDRVRRRLVIADGPAHFDEDTVVVGEHPIPGAGSLLAGRRLLEFLRAPSDADCTLFLISGGASSLCVVTASPLDLEDLGGLWAAALTSGIDITTLNRLRAASSAIAGGGVLRDVSTMFSQSLIMVDNVISGAQWVASGLTYDYQPDDDEVDELLVAVGLRGTDLGDRIRCAAQNRRQAMSAPTRSVHENSVVAEPSMMLEQARDEARRRGYRVVFVGADVRGDVDQVSKDWTEAIKRELGRGDSFCVIGVGEVTIRVLGSGLGGRCQEFAWAMAGSLASLDRDCVFLARASDGRDFLVGVGGAWVDNTTRDRAEGMGFSWADVAADNDSYRPLAALDQLVPGGHTGWNLCDLYVACVASSNVGVSEQERDRL